MAVPGSPVERAARAAASSSSALRVDCPPIRSSCAIAASASASASGASPATISTSQRRTDSMNVGVPSLA